MKKIKEQSYAIRLIVFIVGFLIGWFLYLFIFDMITGKETISDLQVGVTAMLSLITMIIYEIISEFNYLRKLELTTGYLYSNISAYKNRESKLLYKAEHFILEFFQHESDVQKTVTSLRSANEVKNNENKEPISLRDLKLTVENYPDLKSDKHISKILDQLEGSQNSILNSKILYNEYVAYYNSAIVSFPGVLLSGLWKLKMLQFYVDEEDEDL